MHAGEEQARIVDVLEKIETGDDVEGAFGEGGSHDISDEYLGAGSQAGFGGRFRLHLDTVKFPVTATQRAEEGAGTAADIEKRARPAVT